MRKKLKAILILLTFLAAASIVLIFLIGAAGVQPDNANANDDILIGVWLLTPMFAALLTPLWLLYVLSFSLERSLRGQGHPVLKLISAVSIVLVPVGVLFGILALLSWVRSAAEHTTTTSHLFYAALICVVLGLCLAILNKFSYPAKSKRG